MGIVAGGLLGPLVGMAVPLPATEPVGGIHAESSVPLAAGHMDEAFEELEQLPRDDELPPRDDEPPLPRGEAGA